MTEFELKVNGLTCGACERVISRIIGKFPDAAVVSFDFARGLVRIQANDSDYDAIVNALNQKGYLVRNSQEGELKGETALDRLDYFFKGILGKDPSFALEKNVVIATALVLGASIATIIILSNLIGWAVAKEYLPWLLLGSIGLALGMGSVVHLKSFGKQSCQTGMMTGMGIGMILGFLGGALFGATSGMFVGSILGIIIGMSVGAWLGHCCGNMGVLEGLMAGLMAGTMGAMLSVMMVFDHQLEFAIILWIVCGIILIGLSYMLFAENGPVPVPVKINHWKLIGIGIALTVLIDLIILLGPKAATGLAGGI